MLSVFEKIINRDLPAHIVDENSDYIAILSKEQLQKGHTLIIPKKKVDKYTDMPDLEFRNIESYALGIAKILKKTFPDKDRIVLNIVGFEVDHLHIHLIPCNNIQEAMHSIPIAMEKDELEEILRRINLSK